MDEGREELAGLVRAARGGDGAAWEALYRRAYPRLLAYARRRLPSDDAARDAVSETMARAVRSIGRFRDDGNGFDAWLSGIVRHVVLDAQRTAGRRPVVGEAALPDLPSAEDGPEAALVAGVDAASLRAAFARLDPADRELLELRVVLGLSSDEVASVLGKRAGAVRMAQARALERLRAHLAAVDPEAVLGRGR